MNPAHATLASSILTSTSSTSTIPLDSTIELVKKRVNAYDEKTLIAEIHKNGALLQYVREENRTSAMCIDAFEQNPDNLKFLQGKGCNDATVMLYLLARNDDISYLSYMSYELMRNRDFVLKAAAIYGGIIWMDKFKTDVELAKIVVASSRTVYTYLDSSLRCNKDIARLAAAQDLAIIDKFPDVLADDEEFMLSIVKEDGNAIRYVKDVFQNEKFSLEAMQQNIQAFKYCSSKIRDTNLFALKSVKIDYTNLKYVGERLRNDGTFICSILKVNGLALLYAGQQAKCNSRLVYMALIDMICKGFKLDSEELYEVFMCMGDSLKNNEKFIGNLLNNHLVPVKYVMRNIVGEKQ